MPSNDKYSNLLKLLKNFLFCLIMKCLIDRQVYRKQCSNLLTSCSLSDVSMSYDKLRKM